MIGKFWRPLGPVSASATSFGFTPPGARSIPSPALSCDRVLADRDGHRRDDGGADDDAGAPVRDDVVLDEDGATGVEKDPESRTLERVVLDDRAAAFLRIEDSEDRRARAVVDEVVEQIARDRDRSDRPDSRTAVVDPVERPQELVLLDGDRVGRVERQDAAPSREAEKVVLDRDAAAADRSIRLFWVCAAPPGFV
jgi:hypothetical protein